MDDLLKFIKLLKWVYWEVENVLNVYVGMKMDVVEYDDDYIVMVELFGFDKDVIMVKYVDEWLIIWVYWL